MVYWHTQQYTLKSLQQVSHQKQDFQFIKSALVFEALAMIFTIVFLFRFYIEYIRQTPKQQLRCVPY